MKRYLLAATLTLSCINAHADGLLDGISNLAEPYKSGLLRIFGNLGSSSSGFKMQEPLTRKECLAMLREHRDEKEDNTIHSVIYYLGEGYSEKRLYDPYDITPASCEGKSRFDAYQLGLPLEERLRPNSYDGKSILAESRCVKYLTLEKVEVVSLTQNKQEKTCRKVHLSLDNEKFAGFYCVGDNNLYVDYHSYPVKVIKEIPINQKE